MARAPASRDLDTPASRRLLVAVLRVLLVVAATAAWQLAVVTGAVSRSAVAAPSDVIAQIGPLATTTAFWSAVWDTISTWAAGLAAAVAIAVPLGIAVGSSGLAYRMSRFTIDFLRTIPPIALVSLVLLLLGATQQMALVLVIFGSLGPLLLPTVYGVQHVEPQTREMARSYRLRRRDVLLRIVIPSALPFIATGLRVAATISLLLTIGAELIGGAPGLGNEIAISQQNDHIPQMYCYIVVCAVLGSLLNLAMIEIEKRVIRWSPSRR